MPRRVASTFPSFVLWSVSVPLALPAASVRRLWGFVTAAAAATPATARARAAMAADTTFFVGIVSSCWVRRCLRTAFGRGFLEGLLRRELADDLAGRDRLAGLDGEAPHDARVLGVHLVLHLHRFDDADDLARRAGVALGHGYREDGALHRRDDRVTACAASASPDPLPPPLRKRAPLGLGLRKPNLEPAPVHLHGTSALRRPSRPCLSL